MQLLIQPCGRQAMASAEIDGVWRQVGTFDSGESARQYLLDEFLCDGPPQKDMPRTPALVVWLAIGWFMAMGFFFWILGKELIE